jgi:hypothetical protein
MLIIQIALGIVLALVLLVFLPQIFSISIWLLLAAAAIGVTWLIIITFSEYLIYFGCAVLMLLTGWAVYVIFTDISNKKFRTQKEKIDEIKNKINNLQQLFSISENAENNSKTLKQSLKSREDIRKKLKIQQDKLEKLKSEITESSVDTQ